MADGNESDEAECMDDDRTTVQRILAGDGSAYRVLVTRHASALLAWVGSWLSDRHEREDATQEAFLSAWRHLESWDPGRGSFKAWLFGIARNAARSRLRRRRPLLLAAPPEATDGGPEEPADPFKRLDEELARLPDAQRSAFLLSEVHGLPLAEVAELEDVPVGTIKSRVARARSRLRARLARVPEVLP